jgi:hypothetical protein
MASMGKAAKTLEDGEQDSFTLMLEDPDDYLPCDECFEHIFDGDKCYRKNREGVTYNFCSRECREVVS